MKITHNIRATKERPKEFINNFLNETIPLMVKHWKYQHKPIELAEVGKQDTRGVPSISFYAKGENGAICYQRTFANTVALFSFLEGFQFIDRGF